MIQLTNYSTLSERERGQVLGKLSPHGAFVPDEGFDEKFSQMLRLMIKHQEADEWEDYPHVIVGPVVDLLMMYRLVGWRGLLAEVPND